MTCAGEMDWFKRRDPREPFFYRHNGKTSPPRLGREGEALAAAFLRKKGYRIIEENYRCPLGEADIIAVDGKTLCFVEVKTRSTCRYDRPEGAVHERKQQKLSRTALWYLKEKRLQHVKARFDVIAISRRGSLNEIHHFENAFEVSGR
jgi:putative endonuclease